ncbi:IS66 family transposase [Candidatus Sumerlaeota bacterium]
MTDQFSDEFLLNLTPEQAQAIVAQGDEASRWALLRLSALARGKSAKSAPDPSTPSAMIAPYQKPDRKGRKKTPGRKQGHAGARRATPQIDRREQHRLECCPECGGPVSPPRRRRARIVEDIEQTRAVTTEHQIHAHYCPRCKKRVEPKVTAALSGSSIGHRALALSSWLHYGLGNSLGQIVQVFNALFQLPVSEGGLTQMWQRLAKVLEPWYDEIITEAAGSAVLHADETGWRVNGKTHWLWCFTQPSLTCYLIDESRGSKVLTEFLGECFEGILVSDFFSAYSAIKDEQRQVCFAHLLREIKKVSERDGSDEWRAFAKKLKRLLKDALRLAAHHDRLSGDYGRAVERLYLRLGLLTGEPSGHPDCRRLKKRLRRHHDSLFAFLEQPNVPPDNNRAERELRPAVIARKNSFHNMSDRGAKTQSALMSIYRTLKLRGHDPLETIAGALTRFIAGGQLPPLPRPRSPDT